MSHRTAAEILVSISVEADGPMSRQELAGTVGAWVENLPKEMRTIQTTNDNGDHVIVVVRCSTGAR